MKSTQIPLLGIVAYSGTGKTTLLKKLIPYLRSSGIRTGLIKHTHHNVDVDVDTPGKDSFELRKAGADQTMIASSNRWALMTETPLQNQPDLNYLASRFDCQDLDVILVEGFKHEKIEKIALHRENVGRLLDKLIDDHVIAVATDLSSAPIFDGVRVLDLNNVGEIGEFVIEWLRKKKE